MIVAIFTNSFTIHESALSLYISDSARQRDCQSSYCTWFILFEDDSSQLTASPTFFIPQFVTPVLMIDVKFFQKLDSRAYCVPGHCESGFDF